jgi:hypothetical protein
MEAGRPRACLVLLVPGVGALNISIAALSAREAADSRSRR